MCLFLISGCYRQRNQPAPFEGRFSNMRRLAVPTVIPCCVRRDNICPKRLEIRNYITEGSTVSASRAGMDIQFRPENTRSLSHFRRWGAILPGSSAPSNSQIDG